MGGLLEKYRQTTAEVYPVVEDFFGLQCIHNPVLVVSPQISEIIRALSTYLCLTCAKTSSTSLRKGLMSSY